MDHAIEHSTNGSSGHEHREANVGLIVISALGLAVVVAIVLALMWGTFNLLKNDERASETTASPLAPAVQIPPEPRLEEKPYLSMQALREHENHVLGGYAWQDQKSGVVRIPIAKAMDILAQRGLPVQQPGAAKPAAAKSVGVKNAAQ